MIITKMALPRRTFLRGMGVSVALPLLDAMVPALSAMSRTAANPISRVGFYYVPNGVIMDAWLPKGEETSWEISPTLAPLAPFRDRMVVVSGLANKPATQVTGGVHSRCQTSWLCGVPLNPTEGADIRAGVTLDQLAANKLGEQTSLRSLELCTEPTYLGAICEQGTSCVYSNTFSWRSPTAPMPMEDNPRVVFERLFGEGGSAAEQAARARTDRSILDWIRGEMHSLQGGLGGSDRTTVNDYLEAVRDVERRLQKEERRMSESPFEAGNPPERVPEVLDGNTRLLLDLQVLAWRADITRVVSFMIRREQSQATYPQFGVVLGHHELSHHQNNTEKLGGNIKVNTHHMTQFAEFVKKLNDTPDGDGSLLDHSMMFYGAGMGDPNVHNNFHVPALLVGGGCGQLKGGRFLKAAKETPLMNLGLSLLDKLGVEVDSVGDSTGHLADL